MFSPSVGLLITPKPTTTGSTTLRKEFMSEEMSMPANSLTHQTPSAAMLVQSAQLLNLFCFISIYLRFLKKFKFVEDYCKFVAFDERFCPCAVHDALCFCLAVAARVHAPFRFISRVALCKPCVHHLVKVFL